MVEKKKKLGKYCDTHVSVDCLSCDTARLLTVFGCYVANLNLVLPLLPSTLPPISNSDW